MSSVDMHGALLCCIVCLRCADSYFQEPWAMAVYHDRFSDFRDEVRELLISRPVRTH